MPISGIWDLPIWIPCGCFPPILPTQWGISSAFCPGGDTLLFMNIYTALVVSVTALIAYFFLVKKCGLPFWTVFAGRVCGSQPLLVPYGGAV